MQGFLYNIVAFYTHFYQVHVVLSSYRVRLRERYCGKAPCIASEFCLWLSRRIKLPRAPSVTRPDSVIPISVTLLVDWLMVMADGIPQASMKTAMWNISNLLAHMKSFMLKLMSVSEYRK